MLMFCLEEFYCVKSYFLDSISIFIPLQSQRKEPLSQMYRGHGKKDYHTLQPQQRP